MLAVRSVAVLTVSAMIPTAAARIVEEGREVIGAMYRPLHAAHLRDRLPALHADLGHRAVPADRLAEDGARRRRAAGSLPHPRLLRQHHHRGRARRSAIGAGHPGVASANSVLIAIMNVILTVALAPSLGLWGVVAGTFLAVTVGSVIFNCRFLRLFEPAAPRPDRGPVPTAALALGLGIPPGGPGARRRRSFRAAESRSCCSPSLASSTRSPTG